MLSFLINGSSLIGTGIEKKREKLLKDYYDMTPLHVAVRHSGTDAVKSLLQEDATDDIDINKKDGFGKTPLHIAAEKGDTDIVKLLIEKGANIGVQAYYNMTALHLAVEAGHIQLVELLIESGANINAKDSYNMTPLHYAAEKNHVDIAKLLIQLGANIDAQDSLGRTSLHIAFTFKNINLFLMLLCHNADATIADNNQNTPPNMVDRALKNAVNIGKSRLSNDITKEELYTLIQKMIQNTEASTYKEQLQVIGATFKDPSYVKQCLGYGRTPKNARKRFLSIDTIQRS